MLSENDLEMYCILTVSSILMFICNEKFHKFILIMSSHAEHFVNIEHKLRKHLK